VFAGSNAETGRQGDEETGRQGDAVTGRQGDAVTGRWSDAEIGRRGDAVTERRGDAGDQLTLPHRLTPLPRHSVTPSPSHPLTASPNAPIAQDVQSTKTSGVLDLISRQKYDEAITRLDEILEKTPNDGEALTYLATANLYQNLDFLKAQTEFQNALKAGGGATFFVTHSHENFTTDAVVDYCRGWLHLRKSGVEFVPLEGTHGFTLKYSDVEEFKRNKLSGQVFHIKFGNKSQNFRGRSKGDLEPLLIVALYKSFTQN
jgi:hypothetical protein